MAKKKRKYYPRQPKQRKYESWKDYVQRSGEWYKKHGKPPATPQEIAHLEAWKTRAHKSARAFAERSRQERLQSGLVPTQLPNGTVWSNEAGANWLKRFRAGEDNIPLKGWEPHCLYLQQPCFKPSRWNGYRSPKKAGALKAKLYGRPQFLFPEMETPTAKRSAELCCVEGLYRLQSRLKKEGFIVELILDENDVVKRDYESLFGMAPCWKD